MPLQVVVVIVVLVMVIVLLSELPLCLCCGNSTINIKLSHIYKAKSVSSLFPKTDHIFQWANSTVIQADAGNFHRVIAKPEADGV